VISGRKLGVKELKCRLDPIWGILVPFWSKLYTIFGSVHICALSQRVKGLLWFVLPAKDRTHYIEEYFFLFWWRLLFIWGLLQEPFYVYAVLLSVMTNYAIFSCLLHPGFFSRTAVKKDLKLYLSYYFVSLSPRDSLN